MKKPPLFGDSQMGEVACVSRSEGVLWIIEEIINWLRMQETSEGK